MFANAFFLSAMLLTALTILGAVLSLAARAVRPPLDGRYPPIVDSGYALFLLALWAAAFVSHILGY